MDATWKAGATGEASVELYAAAAALPAYAGLQWLARRRPAPGTVALAAVLVLGLSQVALDTLRLAADDGHPAEDQLASLAVAALSLVLLQARLRRASARTPAAPAGPGPTRSGVGVPDEFGGRTG